VAYITVAELQASMSPTSFATIFDDDNDSVTEDATVDAAIERASALVDAWISPVYAGPFPITQTPVPAMIRELTIQYALAFAYQRRPDYTRTLESGDANERERWDRADAMGERLQKAILRIVELPNPANVGSTVHVGGAEVSSGEVVRVFDDMGDF
jgi:hypothetical protein